MSAFELTVDAKPDTIVGWKNSSLCPPYPAHELEILGVDVGADQFIWVAVFLEDKDTLQWVRLPTSLQSLASLYLLHSQPVPAGTPASLLAKRGTGPYTRVRVAGAGAGAPAGAPAGAYAVTVPVTGSRAGAGGYVPPSVVRAPPDGYAELAAGGARSRKSAHGFGNYGGSHVAGKYGSPW